MEIRARNINDIFSDAVHYLLSEGVTEKSRNGDVLVAKEPVTLTYLRPKERVLFSPLRDANPFFHLMESLWMLAGRNNLAWPLYFNSKFKEYSDDGITTHGAYGYRWRNHFGFDQLERIANELVQSPTSRRAVLQMWSSGCDLNKPLRDVPCNTQAYFDLRGGVLNMTVCNRSNDAIWGAFGANVVHFSILQEYLAAWLRVPVGVYNQFTNNLHAYTDIYNVDKLRSMAATAVVYDQYKKGVEPYPLVSSTIDEWDKDLCRFMDNPKQDFHDPFFQNVAKPMYLAWDARKTGAGTGREQMGLVMAEDWRAAGFAWILRREEKMYA